MDGHIQSQASQERRREAAKCHDDPLGGQATLVGHHAHRAGAVLDAFDNGAVAKLDTAVGPFGCQSLRKLVAVANLVFGEMKGADQFTRSACERWFGGCRFSRCQAAEYKAKGLQPSERPFRSIERRL